jgi:hypothetical protein
MQSSPPLLPPPPHLPLHSLLQRPSRQPHPKLLPAHIFYPLSIPPVSLCFGRAGYVPPSVSSTPPHRPPSQFRLPNPQPNRRLSDLAFPHPNPQCPPPPHSKCTPNRLRTSSASSHLSVSCSPCGPSYGTHGDLYRFVAGILSRNPKLR